MNRPKKFLWGTGIVVGVLAVATAAFAAGRPTPEPAPAGMAGFFQSLTAEQQTAIQKLVVEHEKKIIPLRAELEIKRLELQTLITEEASEQKLNAKIEEIGMVQTEFQKQHVGLGIGIRKLLTAEQKAKFDVRHLRRLLGRGPGWMDPGEFPPDGMLPGFGEGPGRAGGGHQGQ